MTGADVELEDVTVAFEGRDVPALHRVSLTVRAGERLALVGPSGAGKSTLLRLLLGGVRPAQGRVRVVGLDPFGPAAEVRPLRQLTGFVRQRDDLVPGVTARTNILMGQSWAWRFGDWWAVARGRTPSRHASRLAELAAVHGIAHLLGERVEHLSGGQRQRVALARALLGAPRLLLADEVTSGLDPVTAARAVADLTSAADVTVLVSTHDLALAGRFPRVVALRPGRVVYDGAPPDPRNTELIYATGTGLRGSERTERERAPVPGPIRQPLRTVRWIGLLAAVTVGGQRAGAALACVGGPVAGDDASRGPGAAVGDAVRGGGRPRAGGRCVRDRPALGRDDGQAVLGADGGGGRGSGRGDAAHRKLPPSPTELSGRREPCSRSAYCCC